jgi:hypothetical protein
MSRSSTHALSTRLFIQGALTGLLAPTAARGSTWLVVTLAVAAGAVAVALLLRSAPANAKQLVVGFEAAALAVGGLGLVSGHYIPGTIVGVVTLITALNAPTATAAADSPWVAPPAGAPAYAPPGAAVYAPPALAPPSDNPYASPGEPTLVATAPLVPPIAFAPPAPAPVAVVPPQFSVPEPPAERLRPEDVPPATRSLTILPGK